MDAIMTEKRAAFSVDFDALAQATDNEIAGQKRQHVIRELIKADSWIDLPIRATETVQ